MNQRVEMTILKKPLLLFTVWFRGKKLQLENRASLHYKHMTFTADHMVFFCHEQYFFLYLLVDCMSLMRVGCHGAGWELVVT